MQMTLKGKAGTSRRELLTGMGLAAGMTCVPGLAAEAKSSARWDLETDVVCVWGAAQPVARLR
jgi:hypothetical protein